MKTLVSLILIAILVVSLVALVLAGCETKTPSEIADNYQDLAAAGEFQSDSGGQGDFAEFSFGKEITFNTLILRESGSKITQFSLFKDDEDEPFYSSDLIEAYRVCSFEPITASKVRIRADKCDKKWSLKSLEAYYIDKKAGDDFRIMGYITVDSLCMPVLDADEGMEGGSYGDQDGGIDESYTAVFETVTQFNLISGVYFTGAGEIVYKDIASHEGSGEEDFEYALAKLRRMAPSAEIVVTVLANDNALCDDGYADTISRHNAAMGANAATLTKNLLELIDRWGVDGISFDYEYPSSSEDYRTYGEYLISLRKALDEKYGGKKLLTAAIADWCMGKRTFKREYMDALDQIEVMAYDLFDERGYHSTFYKACYQIVENCRKNGADMSKVHLGVPYYSRPVNQDSFWGNYKVVSSVLPPSNVYTFPEPYTDLDGNSGSAPNYFNDRQMIYDKTSYAIDMGLGGMMIWHMACDDTQNLEKSLTGAMKQAIEDRNAL